MLQWKGEDGLKYAFDPYYLSQAIIFLPRFISAKILWSKAQAETQANIPFETHFDWKEADT